MCGIAGILKFDRALVEAQVLKTMSDSMSDRGPDDLGFLSWSGTGAVTRSRHPEALEGSSIALIHRRLSILDLSEAGWQPMGTPDERHYIIFNGEIYNYLELQAELQSLGYRFRSHSDTEVLLTAYCHWGSQVLNRLVGMFAFAVLDTQTRQLFLARDCFGIKPLYYTYWQGGFAFASEIKTLLEIPGVSRQVNPKQLYNYLRFGLTDEGRETLFASVYQLQPAHYLEISLTRQETVEPVRYWQVDLDQHLDISFEAASDRLRELFLENIHLHARSDVPVGAALSGGMDSSSIVMAMRHLYPNQELHTFCYVADDPALNEERWADIVGKAGKTVVHKVRPNPEELIEDLDRLVYIQDAPFGSISIYAQHRVFRLAREAGIKVMLDGQGADQLLGGAYSYLAGRIVSLIRQGQWVEASRFLGKVSKLPNAKVRGLLVSAGGLLLPSRFQGVARQLVNKDRVPSWLNSSWFVNCTVVPQSLAKSDNREMLRQMLYQNLVTTSLPSQLRYEDRNSMAYSIESRVPFLTPAFVNFVFSLPEEYIISPDGTIKAVLRQAMRGIVPDAILERKDKIGFATPDRKWLSVLRPWVERVLHSEVATQIPALNLKVAQENWQAILHGRSHFDYHVWRWVNLIKWAEQYAVTFSGTK